MTIVKRDKKGRIIKGGVKPKPLRLCLYCEKNERRKGRKYCSRKCFGLAERGYKSHRRGLTLEAEYGEKKAKLIKGKYRESHLGKKTHNLGKKMPEYAGEKHWNWQGGKTKLGIQIRESLECKIWKRKVLKRDNYTCQNCKKIGGDFHIDHIKPLSQIISSNNIETFIQALKCKELWALHNGRTLCVKCHKETSTYPKNLRYATVRPYRKRTVRNRQK